MLGVVTGTLSKITPKFMQCRTCVLLATKTFVVIVDKQQFCGVAPHPTERRGPDHTNQLRRPHHEDNQARRQGQGRARRTGDGGRRGAVQLCQSRDGAEANLHPARRERGGVRRDQQAEVVHGGAAAIGHRALHPCQTVGRGLRRYQGGVRLELRRHRARPVHGAHDRCRGH